MINYTKECNICLSQLSCCWFFKIVWKHISFIHILPQIAWLLGIPFTFLNSIFSVFSFNKHWALNISYSSILPLSANRKKLAKLGITFCSLFFHSLRLHSLPSHFCPGLRWTQEIRFMVAIDVLLSRKYHWLLLTKLLSMESQML